MCCPCSEPYRLQRPTLIGQHHAQLPPAPIGQHHAPWPRPPEQHHDHQVDLAGRDDSPQPEPEIGADKHTEESTSTATVFLKIFNPQNKKQVMNMRTLRDFPCNLETVDDLREELLCVWRIRITTGFEV